MSLWFAIEYNHIHIGKMDFEADTPLMVVANTRKSPTVKFIVDKVVYQAVRYFLLKIIVFQWFKSTRMIKVALDRTGYAPL